VNINIQSLVEDLVNTTVQKPVSGTLSGHAAGEPFDKHVFQFVKKLYANETFRQYEYLNKIFTENPKVLSIENRLSLLKPKSVAFLLGRGKAATAGWTPAILFDEKQNDTADILVVRNGFFNIIDVKTSSNEKSGQPPNIISAYKLAKMCAIMLEEKKFDSHDITYVGLNWKLAGNNLECTAATIRELFKTNPEKLYINWAAAMQVQFHVIGLDQSYTGTVQQWCQCYLRTFVNQAANRAKTMVEKFVKPFEHLVK
jgi:hypothetical protein